MKLFLAAIAACFTSSAMADTYACDFSRGGAGGWIRPVILVDIDPAAGTAKAKDDLTLERTKDWYPAKISVNNKKRYTVKWQLPRTKDRSRQTATLDYRLTIIKTSNKAQAIMRPQGYDNNFQTGGKCTLR